MANRSQFYADAPVEVVLTAPRELVAETLKDLRIYPFPDERTMYTDPDVAASGHSMEIDSSARSVTTEHSVLPYVPRAVAVWPDCPQCSGQDLRIVPYDYGTCSQTGYRDAGERWECRTCGAIGDGDGLGTQQQKSLVRTDEWINRKEKEQ